MLQFLKVFAIRHKKDLTYIIYYPYQCIYQLKWYNELARNVTAKMPGDKRAKARNILATGYVAFIYTSTQQGTKWKQ